MPHGNHANQTGSAQKTEADANEWASLVNCMPCAACFARNDTDMTLVCANEHFYRLFGLSEEDMQCKYGHRLGAVFGEAAFGALKTLFAGSAALGEGPRRFVERVNRPDGDLWVQVEATLVEQGEQSFYSCVLLDVTNERHDVEKLRECESTLVSMARQSHLDLFEYDIETGSAHVRSGGNVIPSSLADENGWCPHFLDKLIGESYVCPEYAPLFREAFQALMTSDGKSACELRMKGKNGTLVWARLALSLKADGAQAGRAAVGTLEDVTQQKETVRNFLNETQFYQAVLAEQDAYAQVDVTEDRIVRVGGMWNLYNEIIETKTYTQVITEFINKVVHPDDRSHYLELMLCSNFVESFGNGVDKLGCEFRRIVDQNKMVWMQLHVHLFRDPLTQHILALLYIKNIDDKKKQELLLLRDSTRDQLTNIYNKKAARKAISSYFESKPPDERYAFIVLDLDDFKNINDLQGHEAGDRALVHLANALSRAFRKDDIIGRFGGDEFIVFLKNVKTREWVGKRIESLFGTLLDDAEHPLACSCGIIESCESMPYEEMFRRADTALYMAKNAGKGCFRFSGDDEEVVSVSEAHATQAPSRPTRHEAPSPSLAESGDRFASGFEGMSDFDSFVGEQGDIAYLVDMDTYDLICGNKAFYDRLGFTEEQCQGMTCYEAVHRRDSPCPFCGKVNWSTDKFYIWKNLNLALDQEFLMKNKLVMWQGREVLLVLAIDVSNDKCIVDSLENGAVETHNTLSGVQRMSEARTLSEAMRSALETVGSFFRADAVRFWRFNSAVGSYECAFSWEKDRPTTLAAEEVAVVSGWLSTKEWGRSVILESPEVMLCESFDMYQFLKTRGVQNQRWLCVKEKTEELGYISIDNVSSNFQNVSFLDSFSTFMGTELKKRFLVENTLRAARNDDLTNLLSRRSFEELLVSYSGDQAKSVGVMLVNFNNLKGINGTRGFSTGNHYIKQFSEMMRHAFEGHSVFRLNGDEFLAIVEDISQNELEDIAASVQKAVDDAGFFSIAAGYAWDDVEKDLSVLIDQATRVMKANKRRYYDSSTMIEDAERRKMLTDLMAALDRGEFQVYFQPKVELSKGRMVGAEALVRYYTEETGVVLPNQFIDMLEQNSLIRYIDLFVFEEVCRQQERWKRRGLFIPTVSMNFSRLTLLERDIASSLEVIISRYDVSKKKIEIEITESMADMGKNILCQKARDLYDAGYSISLDDFGTKYTNLSMLADVDFGVLKLDKSLVGALGSQSNYHAILKNIIHMCQDLLIDVIAEGVETTEQESILRDLECKLGQGYLYGKPMPVEEFEKKHLEDPAT